MADDDEDLQLGSLRAAFRAMADEEPPQRGLAELMAAARDKAEVMARPPWWRRALAQLRRPPMLALATVLVLLGGVLVIGHRPAVQATAPAIPTRTTTPAPTPPPTPAPATVPAPAAAAAPAPAPVQHADPPSHLAAPLRAHPPNHPPREAMPPPAVLGGTTGTTEKTDDATSLTAQCRAAAARGDCATARDLATRIERDDPASYATLQRDAAVAGCLK